MDDTDREIIEQFGLETNDAGEVIEDNQFVPSEGDEVGDTPEADVATDEVAEEREEIDAPEEPDLSQLTALQQEAYNEGWRPAEDFGGDPERHKTAHAFLDHKKQQEVIANIKTENETNKAEFNQRIEGLNKLHKNQLEAKDKALIIEQREAIENADVEGYDAIQKERDGVHKQYNDIDGKAEPQQPQEQQKPQAVAEWEAKNAWVNNPTNEIESLRAQQAINMYAQMANSGQYTQPEQILEKIELAMNLNTAPTAPKENPRRQQAAVSDSSQAPRKGAAAKPTAADLTKSEQQRWDNGESMLWTDDSGKVSKAMYIQACLDARQGQ
tara:strand:- start:136 stop:1116 length:981 start_codon:yes stop_codon:yes gene_type:complete